jgi:DNA repair exonuclease SbcCD ATPase subunit
VASTLDLQIDELYQLPLEQFTEKRNALSKELSGSARTQVRRLIKPALAVWAINQLYWQERPTYSALVDASEKVRTAHRTLLSGLSGHKTDVRTPEQLHRAATERAVAKTINILERNGLRVSSSVLDTIRRSLAALPTDEPRGRLTRPPEPAGFTLLTGVKPRILAAVRASPTVSAEKKRKEQEERQEERQREERRQEERAEKAKQFARAQAARQLERAKQEAEQSASRLEAAERRLAELEKK